MPVAIRNVLLIDGKGGWQDRTTVVLDGPRIASVGPDSRAKFPKGTQVIEERGKTLLPGLIDCHVHYCLDASADSIASFERDDPIVTAVKAVTHARATLEAGITTVRDLGSRDHISISLTSAIRQGVVPGPRDVIKLIATGGVLTPGVSPGAPQLTFEELHAAVQEAARAGRRVAAHAHGAEGMQNAIRAGVHSIEHGTLLNDDALELFLVHKTFLVPTLSAIQSALEHGKTRGLPDHALQKCAVMAEDLKTNFRKAAKAGVRIAMGTDAGTPFNPHGRNAQELRRMVQLGLTPMQAIQAATSSAAALLGLDQEIGTVEPGKLADLVLIDGNPLDDIALLEDSSRIEGVVQGGRTVKGAFV